MYSWCNLLSGAYGVCENLVNTSKPIRNIIIVGKENYSQTFFPREFKRLSYAYCHPSIHCTGTMAFS